MAYDSLYEAAVPEDFYLLGHKLLPLSVGHLILLHRIKSPFVSDETAGQAEISDLALAVLICSMTFEDGVSMFKSGRAQDYAKSWGKRVAGGWLPWTRRAIIWPEKFALFCEYIKGGTQMPVWKVSSGCESGCGPVNLPSFQVVKVELMRKTSLTESQILNRPWSLCLYDFLTIRAMDGQVDIIDSDVFNDAMKKGAEIARKLNQGVGHG